MFIGILLLISTGIGWAVVGIVLERSAKTGVPIGVIQAISAAIQVAVSLGVLYFFPDHAGRGEAKFWALSAIFCAGGLNYFLWILMGTAMKNGPNGIAWAVIQSAFIFPFLTGILFFDVKLTLPRLTGLLLILSLLAIFGWTKNNLSMGNRGKWLWAMWGSLLLAGCTQTLVNLPSYFAVADSISGVTRSMALQLGVLSAFAAIDGRKLAARRFRTEFRRKSCLEYAAALAGINLFTGYFLVFNGLDRLAAAGAGAVGYPIILCTCILAFSVYSLTILKERFARLQYVALLCGILGIIVIGVNRR